jgi:tetratricopeptide (TPR) repeat protein
MGQADDVRSLPSRPIAISHAIRSHLERVLSSATFATADSLRRLLRFVVEEAIAGRGEDVKEYSLGVSVLDRGASFDPKADPIVRVQMRRLREHLTRYYDAEGHNDLLIIDIPKGRYLPTFHPAPVAKPGRTERGHRPFVGRESELQALQSAFQAAAAGNGHVFCVAGEAGIGKSTLVELFLQQLSSAGVRYYLGQGRSSERLVGSDAYLPLLEAFDEVLRSGSEHARRMMAELAPAWYGELAPGRALASDAAQNVEGRIGSQERLKRELVAFLKGLAQDRPLVLVLDDLQWADAPTVDALAYVTPRCTSSRILIVGAMRPDELAATNQPLLRAKLELQTHDVWREIGLPLLTRNDVVRFLSLQFPDHRFPSDLAGRIHDRCEGNPLFMTDLVRFLRDRTVLAERDGGWVLAGELTLVDEALPDTVRSMVQKKIGNLTDADRRLLSAAAVLGPRFESAIVARALATTVPEVEDRLDAADGAGAFVRLLDDRRLPDSTLTLDYGFVHVLYQNALYDALSPRRRIDLSLALAEALQAAHADDAGEVASRLALLFEAGRDFARASDSFLLASKNAARMYAVDQAIALAARSISNAGRLQGRDRDARILVAAMHSGSQHHHATRFEAAAADFERAERAADALGDAVAQVGALFGQASVLLLAKQMARLKECGRRAMAVAGAAESAGAVATATAILAMDGYSAGDVVSADRQLDTAIPVLRRDGFVHQAMLAVLLRGLGSTWRLDHHRAEEDLTWVRTIAGERHASLELMVACWHQARARGNQGRLCDAVEMLEQALRLADLLGDRFWRPRIENTRGWLLSEICDTEAALRLNTDAVHMSRQFGDAEAECYSHLNAARDYLTLGEPHNAWVHLQQAEARYGEDIWFRWVCYPRLQAEMAAYWLSRGDLPKADACARISLANAEQTVCRKRSAWAHKLLADVAMLEDRPHDAAGELAKALTVLECYPCPTIEWQVLKSAGAVAGVIEGDAARQALLDRAVAVVNALADSLRNPALRDTFLRSKPVRDLFSDSGRRGSRD